MSEPFKVTPEMNIEDEISQALSKAINDPPREVFGTPRIRRRDVRVQDSEVPAPRREGDHAPDPINHPTHYTSHPSGVECITVTEWMSFNLGNAVKYIWRAGLKGYQIDDLEKAKWYIEREIARIRKVG